MQKRRGPHGARTQPSGRQFLSAEQHSHTKELPEFEIVTIPEKGPVPGNLPVSGTGPVGDHDAPNGGYSIKKASPQRRENGAT